MQRQILDSCEYKKALAQVGTTEFTKKCYDTEIEARALIEAIDTKLNSRGGLFKPNDFERKMLEMKNLSESVYREFVNGKFIRPLPSGKYWIELNEAMTKARTISGQVDKEVSERDYEKMITTVNRLNYTDRVRFAKFIRRSLELYKLITSQRI